MTTVRKYKTISWEGTVPRDLEGFKSWQFTSGSSIGKDFQTFSRIFRNWLKKNIPTGASVASYNRGHYYLSGFIERNGKYVYFTVGDVRFSAIWSTNILVRTAKSSKDYTGGMNNYTTLDRFCKNVDCLLNR